MRHRAQLQDDGQLVILGLVVLATIASLAAIAGELVVVKDMHGLIKSAHIALAGVTVLTSWAFIQVMFALHYAHDYYAAACHGKPAGLEFPKDDCPDYGDFFYFAAVIGTSGQTADVSFVSKPMRRIGALHCILAYLFNTTVLALLINIPVAQPQRVGQHRGRRCRAEDGEQVHEVDAIQSLRSRQHYQAQEYRTHRLGVGVARPDHKPRSPLNRDELV